jgi:hypothetical protein
MSWLLDTDGLRDRVAVVAATRGDQVVVTEDIEG